MHRKTTHKLTKGKRKYKGGNILTGVLGAARTALLPFIMYKGQKYTQKKTLRRRGKKGGKRAKKHTRRHR